MKNLSKISMAIALSLSFTACNSQISNAKTESVKIYGNCGMCESTIEKSGNLKKIAKVDWDKDTKMATLTYDATKTNQDEILKRIALAGYDSDKFLAPDDVYDKLHGCCQYERVAKVEVKSDAVKENHANHGEMSATATQNSSASKQAMQTNQLTAVIDNYFAVKDALVKTDGNATSLKAGALLAAINAVEMDKLEMDVHMVWMKVLSDLKEHADHISDTKDVSHQRDHFKSLSKNMYNLMKVAKYENPVYYQFCPMANGGKGANWLSKENTIKNPYYGAQMLSCGSTVETIK